MMNDQLLQPDYLFPRGSALVFVLFFIVYGVLLFLTPPQMKALEIEHDAGSAVPAVAGPVEEEPAQLPLPSEQMPEPSSELRPELCEPGIDLDLVPPLPPGNYLYSERYGWFDANHFDAGNPAKVIEDVRRAAASGAGIVSVEQDVRNRTTGYTAHYLVSGNVPPGEIVDIALAIYLDWSYRFEAWQGQPPRSLVGPLTAFAIEDLPSHYVGFFATAHDLSVAQLFACYLGSVEGLEQGPPSFAFFENVGQADSLLLAPVMQQLVNREFRPLVYSTEAGWHHVSWPPAMQMVPSQASSQYWQFESEETWYFDWR
jgi:hypothetical protein